MHVVIAKKLHYMTCQILINIWSGNGLLLDDIKPLSDPILHYCKPRARFNIKIPSYQYKHSHCYAKTVTQPSHLYNGNSHIWVDRLSWIEAHAFILITAHTFYCSTIPNNGIFTAQKPSFSHLWLTKISTRSTTENGKQAASSLRTNTSIAKIYLFISIIIIRCITITYLVMCPITSLWWQIVCKNNHTGTTSTTVQTYWGLSAPEGPHVDPMNLAIRVVSPNALCNIAPAIGTH